jgi:hypothetical protein
METHDTAHALTEARIPARTRARANTRARARMNTNTQMSTRANAHAHCTHTQMRGNALAPKTPVEDPAHPRDPLEPLSIP